MNVSSVKNLNGEVFSAVQDATLTDVVQSNSADWASYQDLSYISGQVDNKLDASAFYLPESATWNDVSTTVQTNSAQWGQGGTGGSSDSFYIYPGTTTNNEVADNSGKNIYLYHSGTNTYLKYAGKITYPKYSIFNFKTVSGTQYNFNKLVNARVNIYPNSNSACKINIIQSIDLLDTNSTVNYANTAYTAYTDGNGNSLSNTYDTVTALSSFVENNSANWGGGSSPAGGSVLFHRYYSYDPNGSQSRNSYISGANDLYFEANAELQQGTPSDIVIYRYGSEIGRIALNQVSSDDYYNYFTAFYNNVDGGEIELQNNGTDYTCYVSANGAKTNAFKQYTYYTTTSNSIKFNIQGYNITGTIFGLNRVNGRIPLTSFTGSLTDFTANGCEEYNAEVFSNDSQQPYHYDITADISEGGSSVASGDVFPPTNNLEPQTTYYLGWNANNGGLFWYHP